MNKTVAETLASQPPETWTRGSLKDSAGRYCQMGWLIHRVLGDEGISRLLSFIPFSHDIDLFYRDIGISPDLAYVIVIANDSAENFEKARQRIQERIQEIVQ